MLLCVILQGFANQPHFGYFLILFKQPYIEPKRKRGRTKTVKNVPSYSAVTKDVDVHHVLQNNPNDASKEVFLIDFILFCIPIKLNVIIWAVL